MVHDEVGFEEEVDKSGFTIGASQSGVYCNAMSATVCVAESKTY